MLSELATLVIFHHMLVLSRLGAAFMIFPGFGEVTVSPRMRLLIVLAVTVTVTPLLEKSLPALPENGVKLALAVLMEAIVGVFIGGMMRMIQATLHMAGMIIAFQSSLASALLFDANQGSQGSVIGNFLTLLGVTIIFTSELHHHMLLGVVDSYTLFPSGHFVPVNDFAEMAANILARGFMVAFQIASPLVVAGTLLYLGAGVLGRLMPTMQVFFVLIPMQVYIAFSILALILGAAMTWYTQYLEEILLMFRV